MDLERYQYFVTSVHSIHYWKLKNVQKISRSNEIHAGSGLHGQLSEQFSIPRQGDQTLAWSSRS